MIAAKAEPTRSKTRPRFLHGLLAGLLLVEAGLLASGCGYRMETMGLPGQAGSLGIGTIRNLTYSGGLDVHLKKLLRNRLLRNPNFKLTTPEQSELVLEIELTDLQVGRALDVSDTDISSLSYRLEGRMSLRRGREGEKKVILNRNLTAYSILSFSLPVIETPEVRAEIAEDVLEVFVDQVENSLYSHF